MAVWGNQHHNCASGCMMTVGRHYRAAGVQCSSAAGSVIDLFEELEPSDCLGRTARVTKNPSVGGRVMCQRVRSLQATAVAGENTGAGTEGETEGETGGETGGETEGETGGETEGETEGETGGETGASLLSDWRPVASAVVASWIATQRFQAARGLEEASAGSLPYHPSHCRRIPPLPSLPQPTVRLEAAAVVVAAVVVAADVAAAACDRCMNADSYCMA